MEDKDYDEAYEKIFEALNTEMILIPANCPPFWDGGFVGNPKRWVGWPGRHYRYSSLTDIHDITYVNTDGKLHRLFGPAYISELYDIEIWYKDGQFHRDNGPALRHKSVFWWFKEGKPHNLYGPAHISGGRPPGYWINGVRLSPKEYKKQIRSMNRRGLIK